MHISAHCRSSDVRLVTQSVHQAQPVALRCDELCLLVVCGVSVCNTLSVKILYFMCLWLVVYCGLTARQRRVFI